MNKTKLKIELAKENFELSSNDIRLYLNWLIINYFNWSTEWITEVIDEFNLWNDEIDLSEFKKFINWKK